MNNGLANQDRSGVSHFGSLSIEVRWYAAWQTLSSGSTSGRKSGYHFAWSVSVHSPVSIRISHAEKTIR
jgi:hypothetical protein